MNHDVESYGFSIAARTIPISAQQQLIADLGAIAGAGRRGLLKFPSVIALARSSQILNLVRPHLPSEPIPVRTLYFDKSPTQNWLVAWHQDLTIALSHRSEISGFGPWSIKEGIPHVQPPVELLQQMLTVRIHLDDADATNGALRVLPNSHRFGRLSPEQIQEQRAQQLEFICTVSAGDALLMRPLLLHASGRSTSSRHRRVLHIEYAGFALPEGLQWNEAA
jgi:Phytanoyl-CoA dioxygenase (PhyH)